MPKRILEGRVVSDKMNKTVTVLVERRTMHPVYKKYVRQSKKYAAHDESNAFRVGDVIQIEECRPLSKNKNWTVVSDVQQVASKRSVAQGIELDGDDRAALKTRPGTKKKTKK